MLPCVHHCLPSIPHSEASHNPIACSRGALHASDRPANKQLSPKDAMQARNYKQTLTARCISLQLSLPMLLQCILQRSFGRESQQAKLIGILCYPPKSSLRQLRCCQLFSPLADVRPSVRVIDNSKTQLRRTIKGCSEPVRLLKCHKNSLCTAHHCSFIRVSCKQSGFKFPCNQIACRRNFTNCP